MARGSPRPLRRRSPRAILRGAILRAVILLVAFLAAATLSGCGGSGGSSPPRVATTAATGGAPTTSRAAAAATRRATRRDRVDRRRPSRPRHAAVRAIAPTRASSATVARVDAASDATLAEGEATVSAGAPSDAEVRREIEEAANDGIALPSGNTSASFAASVAEVSITDAEALAVGASVPVAAWNPARKPIADWIVPVLEWAYEHGWTGTVTSGYRTFQEQAELNAAGDFSAPAGTSNHESTEYPGGAVDVTEPAQLIAVLANYRGPEKLIGGVLGPVDPEHFSATGD
jgi:hypothetical protein